CVEYLVVLLFYAESQACLYLHFMELVLGKYSYINKN
ncbi:hypothetical protein J2Z28_006232, partial [Paenibacillus xylanexedens]|nr:hypothetical protein [Paenibacillus xylanexedens]